MSMTYDLVGYRDEKEPTFAKHKMVAEACRKAGVSFPKETAAFFQTDEWYEGLYDEALEVELKTDEDFEGFQHRIVFDLKNLPEGVVKIAAILS